MSLRKWILGGGEVLALGLNAALGLVVARWPEKDAGDSSPLVLDRDG